MTKDLSPSDIRLDADNPWPGLHEFTESGKDFFNGREEEKAALFRLVRDAWLVVLFGRSGLGKTSLIQAGLFPRLRQEHYLPVYVRLDPRDQTGPLIHQAKTPFFAQLKEQGVDYPNLSPHESLWEYLHRRDLELWSRDNYPLTPVFVFDQFEEVFTLGAQNVTAIHQLRTDLADLIENLIPGALAAQWQQDEKASSGLDEQSQRYSVIISFREDFLPEIESWRHAMPSLMRNRLRLMPMNGKQALAAVYQTGGETLVDEYISKEIVNFVAAEKVELDAARDASKGKGVVTPAPEENQRNEAELLENRVIEPALLSLVCAKLNEQRKIEKKSCIDHDLLRNTGHNIVNQFYIECVHDMPETRRFIEDELITESGYRNVYPKKDAIDEQLISDASLEFLVKRRLLRVEPHMGSDRIELVHDLLTGVIRESRDRRRRDEAEQRSKVAEEAHKQEVENLRQKARRRLYLAMGMVIICLLCGAFAGVSIYQTQKAREANERAEALVNFMLVDLKKSLEPVGRLDLLAPVVERCMSYYNSMKTTQLTDESMGNRAMALRALSQIELARGNLVKARENARQALEDRKSLVANDKSNTKWRSDLSETYTDLGDIEIQRGNLSEARDWYTQAWDLRSDLAHAQTRSAISQKDFAVSLRKLGETEYKTGNLDHAMQYNKQAMDIMLKLTGIEPENTKLQEELIEEYTNLGDIEQVRGNPDKAMEYFQNTFQIIQRLADKDPGNTDWQKDLAVSYNRLGDIEQAWGNLDKAMEYFQNSFQIIQRLADKDPGNTNWQRNLAVSYVRLGDIEQARGNLDKAMEYFQNSFQIIQRLADKDPGNTDWQRNWRYRIVDSAILSRRGAIRIRPWSISKTVSRSSSAWRTRIREIPIGKGSWRSRIIDSAISSRRGAIWIRPWSISKTVSRSSSAWRTRIREIPHWQRNLAVSYDRLGNIEQVRGNLDKAMEYFQNTFQIIKRLADKDPGNTAWQRNWRSRYVRLGDIEQARGNLDKAMEYFQNSFQIIQRLADKDPGNTDWQRNWAVSF